VHVRGNDDVMRRARTKGMAKGKTTPDGLFTLDRGRVHWAIAPNAPMARSTTTITKISILNIMTRNPRRSGGGQGNPSVLGFANWSQDQRKACGWSDQLKAMSMPITITGGRMVMGLLITSQSPLRRLSSSGKWAHGIVPHVVCVIVAIAIGVFRAE